MFIFHFGCVHIVATLCTLLFIQNLQRAGEQEAALQIFFQKDENFFFFNNFNDLQYRFFGKLWERRKRGGERIERRLFGQADDLWALSMTTIESWYKKHPIVKLQEEKAISGKSLTTLEVIKQNNFLAQFKESSVYGLLSASNDWIFILILNKILIPGLDPEPENRQNYFKNLMDGVNFGARKDRWFRNKLDAKVFDIFEEIPEFRLFDD